MATHDEALKASIEYFNGDDLAASVYLGKYALTTPDGDILEPTPDDMHRRLAKEFARIEQKYPNPMSEDEIFELFKDFKYIIPQGSPMAGIGNPYQNMSISNCFVIDSPYDSYAGLLKTDQEEAQIMKRRGGVGFDISTIRPKGLGTANAAKTTDGIGVFMERFSNTCREVAQGGRRGALMLSISVHHPEIETFINIKRDKTKVTGANISVRLTDDFMKAVKEDAEYELRFPVDSPFPIISKMVKAKDIWDQIIESAHDSAEPGLLFWDTVQRRTPAEAYTEFKSVSTNPCGEIVLSPYDSCRLLLVNVVSFVKNPFTTKAKFDWELYGDVCIKAQRLMDDMVDLEVECIDQILAKIDIDPEPEDVKAIERGLWEKIRHACVTGRRTGTGVTAVGDAVAALGLCYGSDESIKAVEDIYQQLAAGAYISTITLAQERGSFPAYDYELEKNNEFIQQIMDTVSGLENLRKKYGRRNVALTTTAPAGSVSVLTQTTSGIEPAFMLSYTRRKKINPIDGDVTPDFVDELGDKWLEFPVYHHWFKKWMEVTGKTKVEDSPYNGALANDIDWVQKVKLQAAAQKWICHAISNTTNLPADVSVETVKDIYMAGWESGCKGITIYREGSRSGVLVSNEEPTQEIEKPLEIYVHNAPKRPIELPCEVHHMTVQGEKWTFFVGMLGDKPYEIMGGLSKNITMPKRVKNGKTVKHNGPTAPKARYDFHYDFETDLDNETVLKDIATLFDNATYSAFTRTISLALRHGTDVRFVVEQIQKGAEKEDDLFSFSKAVSRVLKHYIQDGIELTDKKCLECGAKDLVYQEGCVMCKSCGSSKCG
jgi:ribonucleoside-diphosphate reductase alpha chain